MDTVPAPWQTTNATLFLHTLFQLGIIESQVFMNGEHKLLSRLPQNDTPTDSRKIGESRRITPESIDTNQLANFNTIKSPIQVPEIDIKTRSGREMSDLGFLWDHEP
jgi:hypothetical protein